MKFSTLTLAVVATLAAGSAFAQNYTFKLGGAYIVPNASSSDFSGTLPNGFGARPGVSLEVESKATLMFSLERAINDNFGVELVLGLPPKHDVKLKVSDATRAAAANVANPYRALDQHFVDYADKKVGTVKQLAPTLFFNYKYGASGDVFRPYLGLGINYTKMDPALTSTGKDLYGGVPMTEKLTSSLAPAIQAGVTYKIDKTWSVNAGVVTTFVSSTLSVTGNGQTHYAKFNFTPTVYTASVGYSF